MDFVFGLAGNPVLLRQAAPVMQEARRLFQQRTAMAHAYGESPPLSSRVYEDFSYAAASWAEPWRVIVKAEVMAAGDIPRFVVTSLAAPPPEHVYEDLYCARGNCENDIKAVKNDLHSDRTSATTFLANATRLLLACGAYVLHHALRTHTLAHTALATAQPSTVILTLFKGGHAGQAIQGPDSLAPADLVPCQSAVTPGDNVAHSHPCPRLEYLLRASTSPVACCGSSSREPLSRASTNRLGDSVWHHTRARQGRDTPGCRRIVVWTGPPKTLPQGLSRKNPSPSVYPGVRLSLKRASRRFMKYPG